MSEGKSVAIRLPDGRAYGFGQITEEVLAGLATGILSHLSASFEIRWPGHEAGWGGREYVLEHLAEDAKTYALVHAPYFPGLSVTEADRVEDVTCRALRAAYRAGWAAAPKPVTYPVR